MTFSQNRHQETGVNRSRKKSKRTSQSLDCNDMNNCESPKLIDKETDDADDNNIASREKPFWANYYDVYDKLAVSASNEVRTTEDCILSTRIADTTSTKLAQEIQKLDLTSVDHWKDISSILTVNWDKFFSVQENDGMFFSDLLPLSRYKSNCFGSRSLLLKRRGIRDNDKSNQQKKKSRRVCNNNTKVSKPIEGITCDRPLLLLQHMERVVSAIETNSNSFGSVEYLRLVINPDSFSSTVYNIFTISFLIREKRVSIIDGNDGIPYVFVNNKTYSQIDHGYSKTHFLLDLTTTEWKRLVEKLEIRSPLVILPDSDTNSDEQFYQKFSQSQKNRTH